MTAATDDLAQAFDVVRAAAAELDLPLVEEGEWYGTPALKLGKKGMLRLKDAETLVVRCPLEEKELLLEAAPEIYYATDHYRGWPAILVRLAAIDAGELRHRIVQAWRMQAPRKLVDELDRSETAGG